MDFVSTFGNSIPRLCHSVTLSDSSLEDILEDFVCVFDVSFEPPSVPQTKDGGLSVVHIAQTIRVDFSCDSIFSSTSSRNFQSHRIREESVTRVDKRGFGRSCSSKEENVQDVVS